MTSPWNNQGKNWVDSPSTNTPVFAAEIKEWSASRGGFLGSGFGVGASRTTMADFFNTGNVLPAVAAGQSCFAKIRHEITKGARTHKLVYGNFYTKSTAAPTETNGPTNITIRAAVEFRGTRYPVFFDTGVSRVATSIVLAPGEWAIGTVDLTEETVPGLPFYTLTLSTPDGTRQLPPSGSSNSTWDFCYYMTTPTPGAGNDPITNGAASGGGSNTNLLGVFYPNAVLSPGTAGTIAVIGDSITAGAGDFNFDQNSSFAGDAGGYVARALIGARFWRGAMYGDNFFEQKSSNAKRMAMVGSCDKLIIAMGSNDISSGRSLATIQADMIDTWLQYREVVGDISIVSISPRTTAVGNNWGSGAQTGATGNGASSIFTNLRAWMLDGCPISATYNGDGSTVTYAAVAVGTTFGNIKRCKVYQAPGSQASNPEHPITAVIDAMSYVIGPNGWEWRANTTETTTTDGIHPSANAHTPMSRIIRNALPALDSTEDPPPPMGAGALPFPLNGWSFDPAASDGTAVALTMTAGTIYLFELDVRAGTLANVYLATTAATAATLTGFYVAIFDKYRNRLALSGDQQTAIEAAAGLKTIPFLVPITVPAGRIYVGMLSVTTASTLKAQTTLPTGMLNVGRPILPFRACTANTGQSTIPNPVSGTQAAIHQIPWIGVG